MLRTRADLKKFANRQRLLSTPQQLGLATTLRTRRGGLTGGYLNRLNRLQKRTPGQLKGIPSCGPRVRDWLRGY